MATSYPRKGMVVASPVPRYRQIEEFLLQKIRSGAYPVHHQIPPEEQLARDFRVSRMTANKAIRDLVQAGYLVRQPGLGTFVTNRRAELSLYETLNIAVEVRARGNFYSNDVILREAPDADDETALRLGVRQGTRVFHTVIVHRENDLPLQFEERFVNPKWAPGYLDADFARSTPAEVLLTACPISDVEHVVEAVVVDAPTAALLATPTSAPCLQIIRRIWSGEHLVSYARLIHPGERYKLRTSLRNRN